MYSGTIRLGEGTDSYDCETEVTVNLPWEHITDEQVQAAVADLTGDICQVGGTDTKLHTCGLFTGKMCLEMGARRGSSPANTITYSNVIKYCAVTETTDLRSPATLQAAVLRLRLL